MQVLCIDVGGTDIKYSVIDDKLNFLDKGKVPTPTTNFEDFEKEIIDLYEKYKNQVEGIALSMPGIIDSDTGYLATGGAIMYNYEVNIFDVLKKKCCEKIIVENDAKAAALAEARFGSLSDVEDGVVVILGTGIGGGIIMDGKLKKGSHYSAGEFSPLNRITGNPKAAWAMRCSTTALVHFAGEALNLTKNERNGHKIFEYINAKNPVVYPVFEKYCYEIAEQLMNFQLILDPQRIAIGGGISSQDILIEEINRQVEIVYGYLIPGFPLPKVVACEFRSDANLIGALSCFIDKYS